MPYPLDSETEADIAAGRLTSCDLVDFYVKDDDGEPAFLRAWTWPGSLSFPANDPAEIDGAVGASNVTYEPMPGRLTVAKGLRLAASLASEPCMLTLDASRTGDDADWVGRWVDSNWHQCRMRVRSVAMNPQTLALRTDPHWEFHGLLDHGNLKRKDDDPKVWEIKCQGGLFRVRGRRNHQRTHENQQRRLAGDTFYQGTPKMVGAPLVWAKSPANIPGVQSSGGTIQVSLWGNPFNVALDRD